MTIISNTNSVKRNTALEKLLLEVLARMAAGDKSIEQVMPVNEEDHAGDLLPPPLAVHKVAPNGCAFGRRC